jgi:hypothetical protein
MELVPVYQKEANAFVKAIHRHHGPVVGSIFQIGLMDKDEDGEQKLVGVVICGRPLAKHLDSGWTIEVLRLCTDGSQNACSMLYSAAWRTSKGLGYRRIITAILKREPGTSLKASGWRYSHDTEGRSWNVPSRPRVDKHELGPREIWICGKDFDKSEIEAPHFKAENKPVDVPVNNLFTHSPNKQ